MIYFGVKCIISRKKKKKNTKASIMTLIDGKTMQQGCTADMLFCVDDIIAYVSRFMTLKIGDLLYTGTPVGVGPVSIGQHLEGYLGNDKLLDFHIR